MPTGDRPVYWTGPSLGFDFGADANKVFVLVYNLYDSQRLFRRYPAAEGNAYVVGGFTASYMRRGDIVLIPVRLGVGARLGVNADYMRFSEKNRWLPFYEACSVIASEAKQSSAESEAVLDCFATLAMTS